MWCASNTISVLLRNANNTGFDPRIDYATGLRPHSITVGDFNNDGKLDLATANLDSNTVSLLLRTADNTGFAPKIDIATGIAPHMNTVGDFNADGKVDLAVTNYGGLNSVSVLINGATDTNTPPNPVSTNLVIHGTSSNDTLSGGAGNDSLDGGTGTDTAIYTGNLSNFVITKTATGATIKDNTGVNGTDTVKNIEKLQFDNMTISLSIQSNATTIPAAALKNIEELYVGFFKRVPDAEGLSYWIDQVKAGKSTAQVADSFYDAGVQYGNVTGYSNTMTNDDFIKIVYANVLGRTGVTAPAATDVAFWSNNITKGLATRGSMVNEMITSAHSYANNATWSWVDKLLSNKATVAHNFAVQWGASYSSPELSISKGMEIASAVTDTDTTAALKLVGVDSVFA